MSSKVYHCAAIKSRGCFRRGSQLEECWPKASGLGVTQGPGGHQQGKKSPFPSKFYKERYCLRQHFPTGVPRGVLKHATPDYLVRCTDLFLFRLSNIKMTTANTIAIQCEWVKIYLHFVRLAKNVFFGVVQKFSSLCVPWDEKRWKSLAYIGVITYQGAALPFWLVYW